MEKKIYIKLFDNFEFISSEHLDMFIQVMDSDVALQTLISSIKVAYDRNAFTMGEVEVISKSIRVLSEKKEETKKNE